MSHKACTKTNSESEPPIMCHYSFRNLALEILGLILFRFSICGLRRGEVNLTKHLLGTEALAAERARDYYNHKWKE